MAVWQRNILLLLIYINILEPIIYIKYSNDGNIFYSLVVVYSRFYNGIFPWEDVTAVVSVAAGGRRRAATLRSSLQTRLNSSGAPSFQRTRPRWSAITEAERMMMRRMKIVMKMRRDQGSGWERVTELSCFLSPRDDVSRLLHCFDSEYFSSLKFLKKRSKNTLKTQFYTRFHPQIKLQVRWLMSGRFCIIVCISINVRLWVFTVFLPIL